MNVEEKKEENEKNYKFPYFSNSHHSSSPLDDKLELNSEQ